MLTPQYSHAGKLLLSSNGDAAAAENFKNMKSELQCQLEELTGLVDMATAASDFIRESGKQASMNLRDMGPSAQAEIEKSAVFLKLQSTYYTAFYMINAVYHSL